MTQESHQDDIIPNGEEIVERFGGIRPMASKLGVPVTTVQGWKKRDAIPAIRRDEILSAAAHYGINLKGLMPAANQNGGQIAEDPALAAARPAQAAPSPSAQPQPSAQASSAPRPQTPPRAAAVDSGLLDLRSVHRTARRTSLITTVALLALVGGAGFLLFGRDVDTALQPAARITGIEGRVTALEAQARNTQGAPAPAANGALNDLQQRVADITAVIGASAQGIAEMARDVTAGSGAPLTQRLAVLERQLTSGTTSAAPALSNMINRAQDMVASPEGAAEWQSAIEELRNLVTGTQGRVDTIDAALVEARTQNDALGRTLADVSARDVGAAAMLLALTQLRQSTDRQTPFGEDLALVRQLAGDDAELAAAIDRMGPYAEAGVLSPAGIKRELQASANDIITARLKGEDVSMKEKIMTRLQGLFSIQKDGVPVAGGPEQDLINQASAQLDAGDVAGAMETLNKLQGPARDAAAPVQAQGAAALAAQALDARLVNSIIAKLKSAANTAVGGGSGLTGVVNSGPINMAPQYPPATQTAPTQPAPTQAAPTQAAPTQNRPMLAPVPAEPQSNGTTQDTPVLISPSEQPPVIIEQ